MAKKNPVEPRAAQPASSARTVDDRRASLFEAALQIFVRYGYKKASMDEVARAAGLSRQGLYLHFPSKEALYREGVEFLLQRSLTGGRAALTDESRSLEERVTAAFDSMYGQYVESISGTPHLSELLDASRQLMGSLIEDQEQAFRDAVARVLSHAGISACWREAKLSARDLVDTLDAVACGLKHRAASRADFRERMRRAVRLVCSPPGAPR